MCGQADSSLVLGWHDTEVYVYNPSQRPMSYFSAPKLWTYECKPTLNLAFSTVPYFAYCATSLRGQRAGHALWCGFIAGNCALTSCPFLESCRCGTFSNFFHDNQLWLANNQAIGVICGLPQRIVSFLTRHESFRLLD